MNKKLQTFVMLFAAAFWLFGLRAAAAVTVGLPMADGTYVDWSNADITGCKVENDGANVGSTGSSTVVEFKISNSEERAYVMSFATGSKSEARMSVELTDGSGRSYVDNNVLVPNTGSWDPTTQHLFYIPALPVGDYTLRLSVTEVSDKYAGNWGKLTFGSADSYDKAPGKLTLEKGVYANGPRVESGGNVGYVTNGGSAAYSFICTEAGAYSLGIDLTRYNGGTMAVAVADGSTGTVEASAEFVIGDNVQGNYAPQTIVLSGQISEGVKTLTLNFTNDNGGYIANYKNLQLTRIASEVAEITGVTVGGESASAGDVTDWLYNLPVDYAGQTVTFAADYANCTLNVSATDDAGQAVSVTAGAGGSYSVPVPAANSGITVTLKPVPAEGAAAVKDAYTLRIFRLGGIVMTSVTADGDELGQDIVDALNSDAHTASLTGRVYTVLPVVQAHFIDGSVVEAEGTLSGTTATYSFTATSGTLSCDYTLTVEEMHIYNKTDADETVQLKYTSDGKSGEGTWSDGLYTLTSEKLDGWDNSSFKFNSEQNTLEMPADVVVKQFILKNLNDNYSDGEVLSVSAGDATVYLPTKRDFHEPDATAYDLVVNIDGHKAGTPIEFSIAGGQPVAWIELTIEKVKVVTPPVPTATAVTPTDDKNHCVVTVTFDREMQTTSATVGGQTVTAEGGSSTLYFKVWDLQYNTDYTFTIAAGAASDTYGNTNAEPVVVDIKVGNSPVAIKAAYDYVVGSAAELAEAVAAVNESNKDAAAPRKTIFIKNGDYDFGSTSLVLSSHNVSLIGESRDGVILHGTQTGISNPVLNLRDHSGFYLQDLTVRNDLDYGLGEFKGVGVAVYGGNKTAMRNVRMLGNQDTQVTGERAYMENCEIHGTVDFICGGGSNYYYMTDLVLENRGGNCIAAPSTAAGLDYGYVFDRCTISCMPGAEEAVGGTYSLGRPWQNEPRIAYINTVMEVLPEAAGWASMANLPTHFYEFGSVDGSGAPVDMSGRENSPTSTNTYNPVLTEAEAAEYNLRNVLGGTDSWLPTEETAVSGTPVVELKGNTISWTYLGDARCYVILRNGEYLDNVTTTSYELPGQGTYTVRSANKNGGLGGESVPVYYATEVTTTSLGWATACLSYDAVVPEGTKAYYISAVNADRVVLTEIREIPAGEGFIFNAVEGTHQFAAATAAPGNIENLLVGTLSPITVEPNSIYVLSKMEDTGNAAMMLYTGTELGAGHAYLPMPADGAKKAYRIEFDTTVGITQTEVEEPVAGAAYNLSGQRVETLQKGHVYIVNGKKVIKR